MGVTGLLPIVFLPLFGIVSGSNISSLYFSDGVVICWGSMIMTSAIEKYGLHVRIANLLLKNCGNASLSALIFGFVFTTGFLSMWMSNTATAALMCPMAKAVFAETNRRGRGRVAASKKELVPAVAAAVDLGIAFAASLGGMATLTGTGSNLVLQGEVFTHITLSPLISHWDVAAVCRYNVDPVQGRCCPYLVRLTIFRS